MHDPAAIDGDGLAGDESGIGGGEEDDNAGLAIRTIDCPHCGEPVVVELELDGGEQATIQDCWVCCRPIRLSWRTEEGKLDDMEVRAGD